jgi:hypothetical protein
MDGYCKATGEEPNSAETNPRALVYFSSQYRVSLCSTGWPQTFDPLVSASLVLGCPAEVNLLTLLHSFITSKIGIKGGKWRGKKLY